MNAAAGFRQSAAWPWLRVGLWCGLIFFLSNQTALAGRVDLDKLWGILQFAWRKVAHLSEYAVLLILALAAFERTWARRKGLLLAAFAFTVLYACTDEWHQTFVPGRDGTVSDVFVDSVGGFLGFCFRQVFLR